MSRESSTELPTSRVNSQDVPLSELERQNAIVSEYEEELQIYLNSIREAESRWTSVLTRLQDEL